MKKILGLLVTLMLFSGCFGDSYPKVWYDVYGTVCGDTPKPGCNYYEDGKKISYTGDPYYWDEWKESNPHYESDCTDSYDPWCTEYDKYLDVDPRKYFSGFQYYDSYGNSHLYVGYGWLSHSGIFYNKDGVALNSPQEEIDRDILAGVAEQDEHLLQAAGRDFAQRYALAEDQGIKVARVVNDWALIGLNRSRTEADLRDFTRRLYGVDFNKVKNSLVQAKAGDRSAFAEVLQDMATAWGTTPETAHRVLANSYGSKLREYNID